MNATFGEAGESGVRDGNAVVTDGDGCEGEVSGTVAGEVELSVGLNIREGDGGAADDGTGLIGDDAAEAGSPDLGSGGMGTRQQQEERQRGGRFPEERNPWMNSGSCCIVQFGLQLVFPGAWLA